MSSSWTGPVDDEWKDVAPGPSDVPSGDGPAKGAVDDGSEVDLDNSDDDPGRDVERTDMS
jgi:hypothetical protein